MELPLVIWITPVVDLALAETIVALGELGITQQVLSTSLTPAGRRSLAAVGLATDELDGMSYGRQIKAIRAALAGSRPRLIHAVGARAVALARFAARGDGVALVAEYGGERWRPWHSWLQDGLPGPTPDVMLVRDDHCLHGAHSHLAAASTNRFCYLPRAVPVQHDLVKPDSRPLPLIGIDLDAISWTETAFFLQTLHWLPELAPCQLLLLGSERARERARRLCKLHPPEIQRRIRFARTCDEPDKNWWRCVASMHTLGRAGSGSCLLQAMAMAATPVLVSDFSTDLVTDCDTGVVCAPRNPYALSQRLQALCEQLPMVTEMGVRARARVLAGHAVANVARDLVGFYEMLSQHKEQAIRIGR